MVATLLSAARPLASTASAPRADRRRTAIVCAAAPEPPSRRGALAGLAGTLAALPLLAATTPSAEAKMIDQVIPAKTLSSFQRKDLLADFQKRAEAEIKKVVTAADASSAVRLLFNDAATYDAIAKTGGVNGSIVLSEELSRPENKDLKDLVGRLGKARDAHAANAPKGQKIISWADTIVLAVKVTQEPVWRAAKLAKNPVNGEKLANLAPNPITVTLGRVDATTPDAPGRFPAPGAPASEVLAFSKTLGVKDPAALGGAFAKRAPFWERIMFVLWCAAQPNPEAAEEALAAGAPEAFAQYKDKYQKSKMTTFRQDYEIDFNDYFNKLSLLGAKIDKEAYLYDVTLRVPEIN
jgi:L-ascorbate peroxidase